MSRQKQQKPANGGLFVSYPDKSGLDIFRLRHPQNVIATIDTNNLARGAGARIRNQIHGCPPNRLKRCVGTQRRIRIRMFVGLRAPPMAAPASVFIGPGEIALTRIPSGPKSLARYRVVASNAAFATPITL